MFDCPVMLRIKRLSSFPIAAKKNRKKETRSHIAERLPGIKQRSVIVVLLAVLTGFLCIMGIPVLMNKINQPIVRVKVYSSFRYIKEEDVREILMPGARQRFFSVDSAAMRKKLARNPWIHNVKISRHWPDSILVAFDEYEPIARWHKDHLLSSEGVVFKPENTGQFVSLPLLAGPDNRADATMQQYFSVSRLLSSVGLTISHLEMTPTGALSFGIGQVFVKLGQDRKSERLQRFVRLYDTKLAQCWGEVKIVDLRYLNGAAVAWQEAGTRPAAGDQ
ncbi:Cell division protein FtsQ [invertebrate metagenome]|uniref:Cell division protein FtsQ n=1 Tax=invertebrate metagenome TaxID=1711999 RepID=A0A2H9TAS9_9ZZZZ